MNDRLQIAAMCLQGLLSVENGETYESKVGDAIFCADALLAECDEPKETLTAEDLELARLRGYEQGVEQMRKDAEPKRVDVTGEMLDRYEFVRINMASFGDNIHRLEYIINGDDQ